MSANLYDWRRPAPARPYAEVIGDPIAQSKSPAIHNFWLGKLGIDAEYRAAHVKAEELEEYLEAHRKDPLWRGCNVTMPHKQAVMTSMDRLSDLARQIGAVNTVVRHGNGELDGHNTDAPGFAEPLAQLHFHVSPEKRVLVLGNGGAARAIVAQLDEMRGGLMPPGAEVASDPLTLAVRDEAKGRALLNDVVPDKEYAVTNLSRFARSARPDDRIFDLVVNASPLGMLGNRPLEFDLSHVTPGGIVYDIVTVPEDTDLLKRARESGRRTVIGLAMLVGQARGAFMAFFGDLRSDGNRMALNAWDAELRTLLTT